jgi:hypothetical protein
MTGNGEQQAPKGRNKSAQGKTLCEKGAQQISTG